MTVKEPLSLLVPVNKSGAFPVEHSVCDFSVWAIGLLMVTITLRLMSIE